MYFKLKMSSINKFEELLITNGMLPQRYFVINDLCSYIEVLCIKTSDIYMLDIPSKYNFNIHGLGLENIFKLKLLDVDETTDLESLKHNEHADEHYSEVNITHDNTEEQLEESYKKHINIKDESDIEKLINIVKQLKRLMYCVSNIKFKICLIHGKYMCFIHRENYIQCFSIKKYSSNTKQFIISVDIETLYKRMDSITTDVGQVRDDIFKILNKNHTTHNSSLKKIAEQSLNSVSNSDAIYTYKIEYQRNIKKLEKMLLDIIDNEDKIVYQLSELDSDQVYDNNKSLKKSKLDNELKKIMDVKKDIMNNILDLRIKCQNLFMLSDQIIFDNTLMLDKINKNIKEFNSLK